MPVYMYTERASTFAKAVMLFVSVCFCPSVGKITITILLIFMPHPSTIDFGGDPNHVADTQLFFFFHFRQHCGAFALHSNSI